MLWEKQNPYVKANVAPFWATDGKIGKFSLQHLVTLNITTMVSGFSTFTSISEHHFPSCRITLYRTHAAEEAYSHFNELETVYLPTYRQ